MRFRTCTVTACVAAGTLFCLSSSARGNSRIVAAHDEWTLSNSGFTAPNDAGVFALNVVDFLTSKPAANILVFSTDFGLTQPQFLNTLTGAGHAVTVSTATPFTLENLLTFDMVFITGVDFIDQILIDYVEAGGGVYICAGTGNSTDTMNNMFMNHFGLQFNGLNGLGGSREITNPHAIFDDVDHLYENNGSTITDLDPNDNAQILVTHTNGAGLYAVYEGSACPTPSPDINDDGAVNGADLGLLLADWGDCGAGCCLADLDGDGVVNGADLGLVLAEWTG